MSPSEQGKPVPTGDGYEFKPSEEVVIGETAAWVGYYSWINILLFVVLMALGAESFPRGLPMLGLGLVFLIVGIFFRGAASSLYSVVKTSGRDVPHLMSAMDRLSLAFRVQVVLFVAAVVGGLAGWYIMRFGVPGQS